ncbi:MAG TPA: hypothetical protein VKT28_12610 [Puia sp.]|nr:hypothetical protein [Puia sp.]
MQNDAPDKRTKGYMMMRAIMDYGMGFLIFLLGIFFMFSKQLGFNFNVENFYRYFFAVLCMVYGGWRAYRGYKKNYFN